MKRLTSYFTHTSNKVVDYKLPTYEKGPYIVDDSCFCPMSEAIKQLSKVSPMTSDEIEMVYDFPNGKDTGKKVPVQRMPYSSDITEISNSIMEDINEITEKTIKAQKAVKAKADFNAKLNSINSSVNNNSSNPE